MSAAEPKGPVGTRQEVGDAASSQRHPPHVDQNAEEAALQQDHPSPDEVPSLPATAHGEDKLSTEEQDQPIRPESMYDDRVEEHKGWTPS